MGKRLFIHIHIFTHSVCHTLRQSNCTLNLYTQSAIHRDEAFYWFLFRSIIVWILIYAIRRTQRVINRTHTHTNKIKISTHGLCVLLFIDCFFFTSIHIIYIFAWLMLCFFSLWLFMRSTIHVFVASFFSPATLFKHSIYCYCTFAMLIDLLTTSINWS